MTQAVLQRLDPRLFCDSLSAAVVRAHERGTHGGVDGI